MYEALSYLHPMLVYEALSYLNPMLVYEALSYLHPMLVYEALSYLHPMLVGKNATYGDCSEGREFVLPLFVAHFPCFECRFLMSMHIYHNIYILRNDCACVFE